METLENKIKNLTTEMLIETFKGLENDNTDEATIVNNLVMSELENRLSEDAYCEHRISKTTFDTLVKYGIDLFNKKINVCIECGKYGCNGQCY